MGDGNLHVEKIEHTWNEEAESANKHFQDYLKKLDKKHAQHEAARIENNKMREYVQGRANGTVKKDSGFERC